MHSLQVNLGATQFRCPPWSEKFEFGLPPQWPVLGVGAAGFGSDDFAGARKENY
jgi:hypothetical protein